MPANLYEKGICWVCRYAYYDAGGRLRCTDLPRGLIPVRILTGDPCRHFRRREDRQPLRVDVAKDE
jgi:hypothetical protein